MHRRRRFAAATALVTLLLLSLPTGAWAASRSLIAPQDGVIQTRQDIRIQVNKDRLERVTALEARLRGTGGGSPGSWVRFTCTSNCQDGGGTGRTQQYALEFDPRSGAPFYARTPANGPMELDVRVRRPNWSGGDQNLQGLELILSVPGSPVGSLTAESTPGKARLSWTRAPEPDISGYRVERIDVGGITTTVADLPPSAEGTVDEPPAPGRYTYRVVTLRPSGRTGTLETATSTTVTVLPIPEPEPEPEEPGTDDPGDRPRPGGDDGDGGSNGDGSSGGDGDGNGNGGSNGDGSGDQPAAGEGNASGSTPRARAPRRGATAPSVRFGGRGIPSLGELAEGFRGSLDYGADLPEIAGDVDDDEVVLSGPGRGGGGTLMEQLTDPDRIAVPIAGGLLLTAVGLHLWRWLKIPLP